MKIPRHGLAGRRELVAVSKCELPEAGKLRDRLAAELEGEVLAISAVTGEGLDRLIHAVAAELESARVGA